MKTLEIELPKALPSPKLSPQLVRKLAPPSHPLTLLTLGNPRKSRQSRKRELSSIFNNCGEIHELAQILKSGAVSEYVQLQTNCRTPHAPLKSELRSLRKPTQLSTVDLAGEWSSPYHVTHGYFPSRGPRPVKLSVRSQPSSPLHGSPIMVTRRKPKLRALSTRDQGF